MLARVRSLVENGRYAIGQHALLHMMEEGFEKEHCVGAVLGGRVLESYPAQNRCLIAGYFHLSTKTVCPLHVVCELTADPAAEAAARSAPRCHEKSRKRDAIAAGELMSIVCFVTAYIPRPPEWISPHVRATQGRRSGS